MHIKNFAVLAAMAAVASSACSTTPVASADPGPAAYIQAAVADAGRPDADRQRDANRKPADVIAFAGIKPGDKVGELLPGGGYFTRIFSKVVGAKGTVYALAPPPPANPPANAPPRPNPLAAMATDPAYANLKLAPLDANVKIAEAVDLVWTSLNYHDLARRPEAEVTAINKMVFDSLKPGGVYIVIDHASAAGAGKSVVQTLHRIDPEVVKKEVTSVGFKVDSESKVLHNPNDPHTVGVHDPAMRGTTDQFVLKFRKPK